MLKSPRGSQYSGNSANKVTVSSKIGVKKGKK
jgi:hypothetical protein